MMIVVRGVASLLMIAPLALAACSPPNGERGKQTVTNQEKIVFTVARVSLGRAEVDVRYNTAIDGGTVIGQGRGDPNPVICAQRCLSDAACMGFSQSLPGVGGVPYHYCVLYSGAVKPVHRDMYIGNVRNGQRP